MRRVSGIGGCRNRAGLGAAHHANTVAAGQQLDAIHTAAVDAGNRFDRA